ncbi:hypothetical protein U5801_05250 [Lamprobacter modestohalophilus]|nr:hypothetical protein [Lamprobacter modestohalophilus]
MPFAAEAHFLELMPSTEILTTETGPIVILDLAFTHPMERGPAMAMDKPVRFGVLTLARRFSPPAWCRLRW